MDSLTQAALGAKTLVESRLEPVLAERGLAEAPRRDDGEAMRRLGARLLSPEPRLCISRFVDPSWWSAATPAC